MLAALLSTGAVPGKWALTGWSITSYLSFKCCHCLNVTGSEETKGAYER